MRFIYFSLISLIILISHFDEQIHALRTTCGKYEKFKRYDKCVELCFNRDRKDACGFDKSDLGCYCLQGFFRNSVGKCVPEDQCQPTPSPVTTTGETECKGGKVFNSCGNKCMESCDAIDSPTLCKTIGLRGCEPGCFCPKGHYMNDKAVCVPEAKCVVFKADNETDVQNNTSPSPLEPLDKSKPGSRASRKDKDTEDNEDSSEDDNSSDDNEKSSEDNDNSSEDNEKSNEDNDNSIRGKGYGRRHVKYEPIIQDEDIINEETPNDSEILHENDVESDLIPIGSNDIDSDLNTGGDTDSEVSKYNDYYGRHNCPSNEKYTKCGAHCKETTEYMSGYTSCPEVCEFGCFCVKGFYRNNDQNCVEWDGSSEEVVPSSRRRRHSKSSHPCPPHETYSGCGNRCLEAMDNIIDPSVCEKKCEKGCFCLDLLKRNSEGICIPPPPKCPKSETFSDCGNRCLESIKNIDSPSACDQKQCDFGCFCKPGYYRDVGGLCFKPPFPPTPDHTSSRPGKKRRYDKMAQNSPVCDEPKCPAKEEYVECGNRCLEFLHNMKDTSVCAPNKCDVGCFCVDGYFRNKHGLCVRPPCPPLEMASDCGNRCLESMENICQPNVCEKRCEIGCFCKNGLKRNSAGDCVQPPPMCPERETFSDCGNRCLESSENAFNPLICDVHHCDVGCFCTPGYYRDSSGKCSDPPPPPCPQSESRSECGNRCLESMESIDDPSVCQSDDSKGCERGCFCLDGYKRNSKGDCIQPPPKCPERETFSDCGNRCLESSENVLKPMVCEEKRCDFGCFCIPGYFRGKNGLCAEPPPVVRREPICPGDEAFTECGNRCMESIETAFQCLPQQITCEEEICDVGCFCLPGLYRDRSGKCIFPKPSLRSCPPTQHMRVLPKEDNSCPTQEEPKCKVFEVFSECKNRCLEMCTHRHDPSVCPTDRCDVGCFCPDGLYRDANGYCVTAYECDPTTEPPCSDPPEPECPVHEEFDQCGSRCSEQCVNKDDTKRCDSELCETGCFCGNGYFRNHYGVCVMEDRCGKEDDSDEDIEEMDAPVVDIKKHNCPQNQEYLECGSHCGLTCTDYQMNRDCSTVDCMEGCFCMIGFLRDVNGVCVPEKECKVKREITTETVPETTEAVDTEKEPDLPGNITYFEEKDEEKNEEKVKKNLEKKTMKKMNDKNEEKVEEKDGEKSEEKVKKKSKKTNNGNDSSLKERDYKDSEEQVTESKENTLKNEDNKDSEEQVTESKENTLKNEDNKDSEEQVTESEENILKNEENVEEKNEEKVKKNLKKKTMKKMNEKNEEKDGEKYGQTIGEKVDKYLRKVLKKKTMKKMNEKN